MMISLTDCLQQCLPLNAIICANEFLSSFDRLSAFLASPKQCDE